MPKRQRSLSTRTDLADPGQRVALIQQGSASRTMEILTRPSSIGPTAWTPASPARLR